MWGSGNQGKRMFPEEGEINCVESYREVVICSSKIPMRELLQRNGEARLDWAEK